MGGMALRGQMAAQDGWLPGAEREGWFREYQRLGLNFVLFKIHVSDINEIAERM